MRRAKNLGAGDHQGANDQANQRAHCDIAERPRAHMRQKHVGRRDAKLLRRAHAHAENQHADNKDDDALKVQRNAENE